MQRSLAWLVASAGVQFAGEFFRLPFAAKKFRIQKIVYPLFRDIDTGSRRFLK